MIPAPGELTFPSWAMNIDGPSGLDSVRIEPLYIEAAPIWVTLKFQHGALTSVKLSLRRPEGRVNKPLVVHVLKKILLGEIPPGTGLSFQVSGTAFQQRVWVETCRIPSGKVTSYGTLARRVGCGSARAVGQALKANPLPIIIPCHRVVGATGRLTGFSSGLKIKKMLLEFESEHKEAAK